MKKDKSKEEIFETTIKTNIERKSSFIDEVHMKDGIPLFSWIDLNPTELCNRKCEFCPRVDGSIYPNQNLNISLKLCQKINDELRSINYKGGLVLSGYGEPMMHPDLIEMVRILGNDVKLEIVTNGDKITVDIIKELFVSGLDIMIISMYDGAHQIDLFKSMFQEANISEESYILRDRWYTIDEDYGVKLTNRAGVVTVGKQDEVDRNKPCYYPFYSMMLDWNGDVMLCLQDWNKKVKMGNIALDSLVDVWKSKNFEKYRNMLSKSKRSLSPCSNCNTNGTLHGYNHIKEWNK
ncbi:MAG: SPASM domain-containing protein [Flavobacteriales bacterium]|nr:SPASM domain-containing protein [Flavobacteriales bacterium]